MEIFNFVFRGSALLYKPHRPFHGSLGLAPRIHWKPQRKYWEIQSELNSDKGQFEDPGKLASFYEIKTVSVSTEHSDSTIFHAAFSTCRPDEGERCYR